MFRIAYTPEQGPIRLTNAYPSGIVFESLSLEPLAAGEFLIYDGSN